MAEIYKTFQEEMNAAKESTFESELIDLIDKYSVENKSNSKDFILAEYVLSCVKAHRMAEVKSVIFNSLSPQSDEE